ncbi:MAG: phenylalanine--tRNA ligase subunit alpha [Clostridia bacterium]|nr:phenylalanine--tRNA ligase subunit alpha [Clostridia bacterium]
MLEKLKDIRMRAREEIRSCTDIEQLNDKRVKYLGKKGKLTQVLRGMGDLPADQRPVIGRMANEIRTAVEEELNSANERIQKNMQKIRLEKERIDVTMPGKSMPNGGLHPLSIVLEEIQNVFIGLGFKIAEGPEVEHDFYNFEALNIPKDHPARDTQDTFYITDNFLLRTQTSPVQIRVMKEQKPPIKIISPGRVYRSDSVDATHSPMFHQIEGLVVDKGVTMGDLKGVLGLFAKELYGSDIKMRFRPHHFPFTEPSAEMDISCVVCKGKGCKACGNSGWLEILGAGMVHPRVLEICDINPDHYSGFAFGMGLDRITTQKYGIDDLRLLFENDVRFLEQF